VKLCHHLRDSEGHKAELHLLRDLQGREADFLVTAGNRPWFAVEVKKSHRDGARSMRYFADRIGIPHLYLLTLEKDLHTFRDGVTTVSADRFLAALV